MSDDFVEDWAPVSIVLKDNSRILGYADLQSDIVRVRGAVEYHIEFNNGETSTHIRPYDPATDDDYIVLDYSDTFCINLMSSAFHNMFMEYHYKKNRLDIEDHDTGCNVVFQNYGIAH